MQRLLGTFPNRIAILQKWPGARCVVLTTYAGDVQATRALRAGAKGYLLKSMLRKELVDTIRTVHSGKNRIPAEVAGQSPDFRRSIGA
jgi:DNA-binding NarL/FixJ family response regulator